MVSLKPDFKLSLQRMEAFWERKVLDRPVVQFTLFRPPAEFVPFPVSQHITPAERWLDSDFQATWAQAWLSNQLFLGDSLPVAWPNLGPDLFAALYGCPLVFGDYGTSWSQPVLADWSSASSLHLDWDSPYLAAVEDITSALLEVGGGRFLVGLTDLHPGGDCLAALRGPQNLALDLLDHPAEVKAALQRLEFDFQALYERLYQRLHLAGQPCTTWTPLACRGKYYLPSNDFSIMISPAMFEEFFLPGLRRECQFLDRSLYHLDGPGALRHLEVILSIPELDGVQFVPTTGDEAFARWAWVYRRIQAAGKALQVTCRLEELEQVMQSLRPQGLYLVVNEVYSEEVAQHMLRLLERWTLRGNP